MPPANSEPPPNPRLGKAGESVVPVHQSSLIYKWEIPLYPSFCKQEAARIAGGGTEFASFFSRVSRISRFLLPVFRG